MKRLLSLFKVKSMPVGIITFILGVAITIVVTLALMYFSFVPGELISNPNLPCPEADKATGPVTVEMTVDEEGRVISAKAIKGNPLLQPLAVRVAYQSRFTQSTLFGRPMKVTVVKTYYCDP
jgi:hypothetical protein